MAPPLHDNLIKHALAEPGDVGAWLAEVLGGRAWAARARWDKLQVLPTEHPALQDATSSDFVFCVPLRDSDVLVVIVLEHQTAVEAQMALRVLSYLVQVLQRPALRDRVVAVVGVVLYQGKPAWTAARTVREAAGLSEAEATLFGEELPQLSYTLLDLARSPQLLRAPAAIAVVLALLREGRVGSAWRALALHAHLLPEAQVRRGSQYVATLLHYAHEVERSVPSAEVAKMITSASAEVEETFVSYADQLREQGLEEGLRRGLEQGLQRGHEEGAHEALLLALSRLLVARFGVLSSKVRERLAAASAAELEAWVPRVLTVQAAEELWASDAG